MRLNKPVSQREHQFDSCATLMSTTDSQSHITYANAAFVEVSGFSLEELHGQPHNLVRHPDMPKEAFEDMWSTLKGGEPWSALVKNRRKNGDHYWVRANAVPIIRNGEHEGYMSVRTSPSREEVDQAETLYSSIRDGRARIKLHKGILVRRRLLGILPDMRRMNVRSRIRAVIFCGWVALGITALLVGSDFRQQVELVACATLMMLAVAWSLESQLARPLETLRSQALDVATGNNRDAVHMDRVDEIGMTMRAVSQLGLMFRWLIDDVSEQVKTVRHAANEIAQGNTDLSSRTEQSAASVEQTASSMDQMTTTVRGNAEMADRANTISSEASASAVRGEAVMAQVVATMGDISQSSRKITDIIGVIDSIAFQTNILALNAAVEAARAGEQGRGFAVVASEVRALAQRSAAAAKEIKALIEASTNRVDSGTQLVEETGQAIADIVKQAQQVSSLIAKISAATQEQSEGIAQVSSAVSHMDQMTQQNAALVEQSAAASMSLGQQTQRLVEAVSVFR